MAKRRGFTLVEALASMVLLGVGVTAALGALGQIAKSEHGNRLREEAQLLAVMKMEEIVATQDFAAGAGSGNMGDYDRPQWYWRVEVMPSGFENLDVVTVTVDGPFGAEWSVSRAVFRYDNIIGVVGG